MTAKPEVVEVGEVTAKPEVVELGEVGGGGVYGGDEVTSVQAVGGSTAMVILAAEQRAGAKA